MDNWIARTEVGQHQGLEQGFGARVAENERRVFHIAYGVLGNRADAEDIAQDTFLRAYKKFSSLRDSVKFRAWVNRIAFRLALNRQRGFRRRLHRETTWHAEAPAELMDGSRQADQQVMVDRLRSEIENLPEKLRDVLQLSIVKDMDPSDVSRVLGIPAGTVRSRLHAARKLLLEAMQ